jgi:hypothetical protein
MYRLQEFIAHTDQLLCLLLYLIMQEEIECIIQIEINLEYQIFLEQIYHLI